MLSTLDWALIETWREAGIPLVAVLRGIDQAFDKYDERQAKGTRRIRKVNGLAWAAQAVMDAAIDMQEAAVGATNADAGASAVPSARESGFDGERIADYLLRNAKTLDRAKLAEPGAAMVAAIVVRLRALADELRENKTDARANEDLERTLTVLEEKLFAALMVTADEAALVSWREQAARELAPYRGRMQTAQLKQVTEQFLHKRMLEASGLPRLSLFYMEHR